MDAGLWQDESDYPSMGFFRRGPDGPQLRFRQEEGRLTALAISGYGVSDTNWLTDPALDKLKDLILRKGKYQRISLPPQLRRVDLGANDFLTRIEVGAEQPRLERLELYDSALESLNLPSAGCPHLELLALSRTKVANLSLSGDYPKLHSLLLEGMTALVDLQLPTHLPCLDTLVLRDTRGIEQLPEDTLLNSPLLHFDGRGCRPKNCPGVFLEDPKYKLEMLLDLLKSNFPVSEQDVQAAEAGLHAGGELAASYRQAILGGSAEDTRVKKRDSLTAVRTWLKLIREEPTEPNRIIKLLINGNGNVGKTTLWCALNDRVHHRCAREDEPTTEGLEIKTEKLALEGVEFRGWDFGGQEVYQGTHRLFLTDGAVHILVLSAEMENAARKGKAVDDRKGGKTYNYELAYFYRQQRSLGPNSQFLAVQTHRREKQVVHPAVRDLEREGIDQVFLDLKSDQERVREIRWRLSQLAQRLPIYGMSFPSSWLRVRNWLADNLNQSIPRRVIPRQEFQDHVVKELGVTDREEVVDILLDFLHATGDLYQDAERLKDKIIIDLRWALKAIYRPFDRAEFAEEATRAHGSVKTENLFTHLRREESSEVLEGEEILLLDFMMSCGLCFPDDPDYRPGRERRPFPRYVIFPRYLNKEPLPSIVHFWSKQKQTVRLVADLAFYDRATFEALSCRLGVKTQEGQLWRGGIQLFLQDLRPEEQVKETLPWGRAKIELLAGKTISEPATLCITLEEAELRPWVATLQGWIGEVFQDLQWREESTGVRLGKDVLADQRGEFRLLWVETCPVGTQPLTFSDEKYWVINRIDELAGHVSRLSDTALKATRTKIRDFWAQKNFYPQVIHFLGHGEKDHLLLHGHNNQPDRIRGDELSELLRPPAHSGLLRLVVFNACHSASLARAVSRLGIYVVGTTEKLTQRAAREFSGEFYGTLNIPGEEIPGAFRKATEYLDEKNITEQGQYYLFFDGNIIDQHGKAGN